MEGLAQLLAVSAVVTGLSHTLTKERLFAPLRERLGGMDTWFGYLVSCPYCASHYVAFVLVPLTNTYAIRVPHDWDLAADLLSWFFSSILVTFVAAFFRIVFYFVDEKQSLVRSEKELVRQETRRERPGPEPGPEPGPVLEPRGESPTEPTAPPITPLPAPALHSYELEERRSGRHAGYVPPLPDDHGYRRGER